MVSEKLQETKNKNHIIQAIMYNVHTQLTSFCIFIIYNKNAKNILHEKTINQILGMLDNVHPCMNMWLIPGVGKSLV